MEEISSDHCKNKEIIKQFDRQIAYCAQKHEILAYHKELRQFTKQRIVDEMRAETQMKFEEFDQKMTEISAGLEAMVT